MPRLGAVAGALGALPARGPLAGALLLLAALHVPAARRRPARASAAPFHPAPGPRPARAGPHHQTVPRAGSTAPTGPAAYLLGLALGLLPCGFLYAALVVAAASGGGGFGALAMLAFGAGTVPGLVAVGLAGRGLHRAIAAIAPVLMLCNAALLTAIGIASFL